MKKELLEQLENTHKDLVYERDAIDQAMISIQNLIDLEQGEPTPKFMGGGNGHTKMGKGEKCRRLIERARRAENENDRKGALELYREAAKISHSGQSTICKKKIAELERA